jgi:hypothetical protein
MKRATTRTARPARSRRSGRPTRKTKASAKARSTARAKAAPTDAVDAMIAANAKALGLPLDPAWHPGVAFNLRLILRLGSLVDEFKLADDAEPAAVFHA